MKIKTEIYKTVEISVVIVSWNVKKYLLDCLSSVIKSTRKYQTEIFVVDNNSSDGTVSAVQNLFKEVKIIANKENLGFSKANNQAVKQAKGRYLLILNPDTIINERAMIRMKQFLESHRKVAMVAPWQIDREGKIFISSLNFFQPKVFTSFALNRIYNFLYRKTRFIFKKPILCDSISAACILMKKDIYDKLHGFNEKLFLYGEENDFCPRVIKLGWKIVLLQNCSIIHFHNRSISQTNNRFGLFLDSRRRLLFEFFSTKR